MEFYPPDQQGNSIVINGIVTVLFPGVSYARTIRRMNFTCTGVSPVEIHEGAQNGPMIGQNLYGSLNGFSPTNAAPVPPGAPIYVIFPQAVAGTDTATATLACTGRQ